MAMTPSKLDTGLTPKQMHFARCVASGMSQAEAYREAYNCRPNSKPKTQQEQASRLMSNPVIEARVERLIRDRERGMLASALSDKERVLRKLRDTMDAPDVTQADSIRLRAAELLGKTVGLFRDVVETTEHKTAAQIEQELLEVLEQIADSATSNSTDEDNTDTNKSVSDVAPDMSEADDMDDGHAVH